MKKALITGITGQDGSYLAELLIEKGYEVHGIIRQSSSPNTARLRSIYQDPHEHALRLFLHYGDLTDSNTCEKIIEKILPDEIYHLGAQSHVGVSFEIPLYTADVVGMSTLRILEVISRLRNQKEMRFYQASSSEMFGKVQEIPQKETTPFYPRSPYGCAKLMGYWLTVNYREAYHLHASNGILFNHESPRRGETFVTRKITRTLAKILAKKERKLFLGNLEAKRDWGFAKDYVEAMWLMLQQPQGDDFVVATGETHSVREFLDEAFGLVRLDWKEFVEIDPLFYRPTEVDFLIGDSEKAARILNWKPKTSFRDLVRHMVAEDLRLENLNLEQFELQ